MHALLGNNTSNHSSSSHIWALQSRILHYRTFVPIKFSYISSYKHYQMAFALVPHSCQNLHFKSCFWSCGRGETQRMAISILLSQPCCTQIILCGLRMIPFVSKLDCSSFVWPPSLVSTPWLLAIWTSIKSIVKNGELYEFLEVRFQEDDFHSEPKCTVWTWECFWVHLTTTSREKYKGDCSKVQKKVLEEVSFAVVWLE